MIKYILFFKEVYMKILRFLSLLCFAAMSCFANDKNCEDTVFGKEESNYMSGYNCFYPEQNIINTYEHFRKNQLKESPDNVGYKNLRGALKSEKDYKDEFENVSIYYIWTSNKTLNVNIFYADKITKARFMQDDNGTRLGVIFLAD
jgi:hypothetical protein